MHEVKISGFANLLVASLSHVYTAVHQLVGRAFLCLLLELASREISIQPAGHATYCQSKSWQGLKLLEYFPKDLSLQADGQLCKLGKGCRVSSKGKREMLKTCSVVIRC